MDETEMEISSESLDGLDDDTEACLKQLEAFRRNWMEQVSTAGMNLKPELQQASKFYHCFAEKYHSFATLPMQKSTAKALQKMDEIYAVYLELSTTSSEDEKEEQELLDILLRIKHGQEARRVEKERLSERHSDNADQRDKRLKEIKEERREKEKQALQNEAQFTTGCKLYGIQMEHGHAGRVQIEFKKIATVPGLEAGVVIDLDGATGPSHVRHWPHHSGVDELARELDESDGLDGLTNFLISARDLLKEQCKLTDMALR